MPILESIGPPVLRASGLFYLGNVALREARLPEALELHLRALALRRQHGKPAALGASLSALGRTSLLLGRYPESLAYYREAEQVLAGDDGEELAFALLGLGTALSRLGDHAAASAPLRQALALREQSEDSTGRAIARLAVAANHLDLEQPAAALAEARQAYFDLRLLPTRGAAVADAEQLLGRILLRQRQLPDAERHLQAALEDHRRLGNGEAAAEDLADLLAASLAAANTPEVRRRAGELEEILAQRPHAERRETLEYRLYRARHWLSSAGDDPRRALPHLRRAYQGLLRKAVRLAPADRHPFLHQVPEHRSIVAAATEQGLSWPEIPSLPG
jgi:tetratricopeptide (TPR) repeat protein